MHEQPPFASASPTPGYTGGRLVDPNATPEQRRYATVMHLTLLLAVLTPILGLAVPLAMWLAKKDQSPFIDDHGKETLNFHISILIYYAISALLVFVIIGFPLLIAVFVLSLIGMIKASLAAKRGEYYRYPACIRFVH